MADPHISPFIPSQLVGNEYEVTLEINQVEIDSPIRINSFFQGQGAVQYQCQSFVFNFTHAATQQPVTTITPYNNASMHFIMIHEKFRYITPTST